jgi:hypothetical protein
MNTIPAAGTARSSALRDFFASTRRLVRLALCLGAFSFGTRLPAAPQLLPGVYGYGSDRAINSAGFGAGLQILHVTDLGDSGPGTLRDVTTRTIAGNPPRVIVFDKSGVITLAAQLTLNKANITIAGQAAPAPGIAVHGAPINVGANNVLIQHLRIRPGDAWSTSHTVNITTNRDAVTIVNGISNVVFDHCTFGWSLDEMAEGYNAYDNVTFHRCIFAEPLYIATHLDESTFSPNYPYQAESLTAVTSGLPAVNPTVTTASGLAVDGNYHKVNSDGVGDYIEYTAPIVSSASNRLEEHILISVIKGADRGQFQVEVRRGSNNALLQTSEIFDGYAATDTLDTFVARATEFILPAGETSLKVRLTITGKNGSSSGYKLGVDQVSLSQPHGMGPYFRDGSNHATPTATVLPGRLAIIGSLFAHLQARGPWVASPHFVLANNVFYHRRQQMVMLGVVSTYAQMHAAIVGNTFMEGRSWETLTTPPIKNVQLPSGSEIYVASNTYNHGVVSPAVPPAIYSGTSWPSDTTDQTSGMAGFVPQTAAASYSAVLLSAGAWPSQRDSMELRVVSDVSASASITDYSLRQGALKNTVIEAGGWPTYAGATAAWVEPLNPDADDASEGHIAGNGYTNIEERLQYLSTQLEVSPSAPPTAGAYQAELATLGGGAVVETTNSGYAGTGYVNFLIGSPTNSTVTFSNVDGGTGGTKILRIRHAFNAASPRTGELVVNGAVQSITFNSTGSFTSWVNKDVTVSLNSGTGNTIILRSTGQDLANVDELAVLTPGAYQAEAATLTGGAFVETINPAYNGTGYVNFLMGSPTNSVATFTSVQWGSGGSKMMRIRFAHGGATPRTGDLVINGTTQPITFNPSGAFTTWTTLDVPVTLSAGANTIAFKATGQDLANIDEILVY